MLKRKYSNSAVPVAIKVVIFDTDTADMKFQDYNIAEDIKRSLAEAGFKRPTDIQFKAIPSIPVSYTHLDVYKRQTLFFIFSL